MPIKSMPLFIPPETKPYFFSPWSGPREPFLSNSKVVIPYDDGWLNVPEASTYDEEGNPIVEVTYEIVPWVLLGDPHPIEPTASAGHYRATMTIGTNPRRMLDNVADTMEVVYRVIDKDAEVIEKELVVTNAEASRQRIVLDHRPTHFYLRNIQQSGFNIDPGDIVRLVMVRAIW